MKTTTLVITTLIAVIGFSFTACSNPNGNEEQEHTQHDWGTPVSALHDEVITFPDDEWVPAPASIPEDESGGPLNGVALRYGTGITKQTDTYTCQECGETKEAIVTVTRTYDFTKLEDHPVNAGLFDRKTLYSYQVIQDGIIVDRDTLGWNAWGNTADPITNWLEKQDIDSGDYDNLVDTDGNPFTPDTSHKYKLQKQERTHKTDHITETRWVKVDEQTITQETLSDRDPGVADINTAAIIDNGNSAGVGVYDGMNDSMAGTILKWDLLPNLSKQAAQLEAFFADSPSQFANLKTAEGEIKNKVDSTTPKEYVELVADKESTLFDLIDKEIDGTSEFNTLWNGYKAGHYVVTRDWRTINGEVYPDKLTAYQNAYKLTHNGVAPTGGFHNGYVSIEGMDINPYTGGLKSIENELVTAALAALGMHGDTQAEKMFRALIIQFGQDNVEFQAFYDDIIEVELFLAANARYYVDPATVSP